MQMFVELMTMYRVPSHEWAGWLVDRLTGKAQGALLNMTLEQRSDWPTLVATLNAHFHVEFEARAAKEELITRKQGNKESVRDFISNLQALARRAFGKDLAKREAAVLKRFELGFNTASLRRTYDDVMLHPGATLTIVTSELVRREGRDDPSRYQANIVQEKEQDNAKKPQHPSVEDTVHKVLAAQAATKDKKPTGDDAAKSNPTSRGRRGGTKTESAESCKEAKDYLLREDGSSPYAVSGCLRRRQRKVARDRETEFQEVGGRERGACREVKCEFQQAAGKLASRATESRVSPAALYRSDTRATGPSLSGGGLSLDSTPLGSGVLPESSPDFAGNSELSASVVPDKDTAKRPSPEPSGDRSQRAWSKKTRTDVKGGPGRTGNTFTSPGYGPLGRSGRVRVEPSIERGVCAGGTMVSSPLVPEQRTSTPTSGTKEKASPEQRLGSPDKQVPSAETKASSGGCLMVTPSGSEESVVSWPAHRGPEDDSGHSMA